MAVMFPAVMLVINLSSVAVHVVRRTPDSSGASRSARSQRFCPT